MNELGVAYREKETIEEELKETKAKLGMAEDKNYDLQHRSKEKLIELEETEEKLRVANEKIKKLKEDKVRLIREKEEVRIEERERVTQETNDIIVKLKWNLAKVGSENADLKKVKENFQPLIKLLQKEGLNEEDVRRVVNKLSSWYRKFHPDNYENPLIDEISFELIKDPRIMRTSGRTYSAETIQGLLRTAIENKTAPICPITGKDLPDEFTEENYPINRNLQVILDIVYSEQNLVNEQDVAEAALEENGAYLNQHAVSVSTNSASQSFSQTSSSSSHDRRLSK